MVARSGLAGSGCDDPTDDGAPVDLSLQLLESKKAPIKQSSIPAGSGRSR